MSSGGYFVAGVAKYENEDDFRSLWAILDDDFRLIDRSGADAPFSVGVLTEAPILAMPLLNMNIVQAGVTNSIRAGNGSGDMQLLRLLDSADTLWDVKISESGWVPADLALFQDDSMLILIQSRGYSVVNDNFIAQVRLSDGEFLDAWNVPESLLIGRRIVTLSNGDWLVCGLGIMASESDLDTAVLRYAADGTLLWERHIVFDSELKDSAFGAAEAPGGDILLAVTGGERSGVVRLTAAGDVAWARSDFLLPDAGNESDSVLDVAVTPDGLIGVTGTERRVDYIAQTIPVIREASFVALLDGTGERLWKTNISGTNLYGIAHTAQDTFVATGVTSGGNLHVVEIDMNGNVL